MMLDDTGRFRQIDTEDMLGEIDGLPDQFQNAWEQGQRFPLADISGVRQVVVAGMGGSAIGADLLAAYAAPLATVPIVVWRDYDLPAFAQGPETLVIVSSHSGNTEEALSAFERGVESRVQLMAITTGGKLADLANQSRVPLWRFEHSGQPRAAVGFSFALLLAAMMRLGVIPDPQEEVSNALEAMRKQQPGISAEAPVVQNLAKLMAGQLIDRWPMILGAGLLAPVARRWRTQIAELAKSVAQFELLPEADHNMVAGVLNPEIVFANTMVVFLRASSAHPRNLKRVDVTREVLMVEGFNTSTVEAVGKSRLAQQWTCLHFGDYTAYYLAMVYGVNPTPVSAIEDLKERLREGDEGS
jgi:glucose/mannose-6-phosphate isomerase